RPRCAQARAGAGARSRADGDGDAEPRGDRRRRRRRRFHRDARARRRRGSPRAADRGGVRAASPRGEAFSATVGRARPAPRRYGAPPGTPRTPTVSFVMKGKRADDVASALVKHGVYCSSGDFYATTIIERIGQAKDGVVRAGCSCYSTLDEVERLLSALDEIA